MVVILTNRCRLLMAILLMAFVLLAATEGFAQGRGQGRGRDKKATKFINGHDARDGRWDGRGPRPKLVRPRWFSRGYRNQGRVRGKQGHKSRGISRTNRRY